MRALALVTLFAMGGVVVGCGGEDPGATSRTRDPNAPLEVLVVNYPLQYFAERIGAEHVRVAFPAPPDRDPAFWSPEPEAIAGFQQADVILLNGAGYAKWAERATLPRSRLVVTTAAVKDDYIQIEGGITHSHGPGAEHSHEGTAFTTWLDPKIAIVQADAVRSALARAQPSKRAAFAANFDMLKQDLLAIDGDLERITTPHGKTCLVGSHPVYQYFARRYGLNLKSVHWEPDKAPDDTQWKELEELLRTHAAKLMIWEGTPNPATVEALKKRGIGSVPFDPCGNVPSEGDYLSVMRFNVTALEDALSN